MTWQEVCSHPALKDLPFKLETDTANPYPEAPEIVVEVLSELNTRAEMDEKKHLYFARGAGEFWLCQESGDMLFFQSSGQIERSRLIPGFPAHVELPF